MQNSDDILSSAQATEAPLTQDRYASNHQKSYSETQRVTQLRQARFSSYILKPIGITLGGLLALYGLSALEIQFYRSIQRTAEYAKPVHIDQTNIGFGSNNSQLKNPIDLVYRDIDGQLYRTVAEEKDLNGFLAQRIVEIENARDRIKARASQDLRQHYEIAFIDTDDRIEDYADWFYSIERSAVAAGKGVMSGVSNLFSAGSVESTSEAVEREIKDYFRSNFIDQILRPENRDALIKRGLSVTVMDAQERFMREVATQDTQLQLYFIKHTTAMEPMKPQDIETRTVFDWKAQSWKSPTHLIGGTFYDGAETLAVGGSAGAAVGLTLAPFIEAEIAALLGAVLVETGALSALSATGIGAIFAAAGAAVYSGIKEHIGRDKFVEEHKNAVQLIKEEWLLKAERQLHQTVDIWFNDMKIAIIENK